MSVGYRHCKELHKLCNVISIKRHLQVNSLSSRPPRTTGCVMSFFSSFIRSGLRLIEYEMFLHAMDTVCDSGH